MFWIPLAMAGMSLLQSQKQNDQIRATNITNKSNTRIANIQQTSNSTISAAQGALSRMTQSIQTMEAQRGYGEQWNQLETQRATLGEQMTKGSFYNRVNSAAKQGALQAQASAAGIGGSTLDMLSASMEIQSDMELADMEQAYSDNLYSLDQEEQNNLYGQYGILAQQDVYLDNVAAATIVGPAKIPTQSGLSQLLTAGMSYLSASSSIGGGAGGGSNFLSSIGSGANTLKSWFTRR